MEASIKLQWGYKILLTFSIWAHKSLNAESGAKPTESEIHLSQRNKPGCFKAVVLPRLRRRWCQGRYSSITTLWSFQAGMPHKPVPRPTYYTYTSSTYCYLKRNPLLTPAFPTILKCMFLCIFRAETKWQSHMQILDISCLLHCIY